jgi:hypothetical protein
MAILRCEGADCDNTQGFHGKPRYVQRDTQGRIIQKSGWSFDPDTGRCVADTSDRSGRDQPYYQMCFVCWFVSPISRF